MRVYSPYYNKGRFGFERLNDDGDERARPIIHTVPLHVYLTRLLWESAHLDPCTPFPYPAPKGTIETV